MCNEKIDIARIADGAFIDLGHPRRHCIPAGDGVFNACQSQCSGGFEQSFAHFFHGPHHPVQRVATKADVWH